MGDKKDHKIYAVSSKHSVKKHLVSVKISLKRQKNICSNGEVITLLRMSLRYWDMGAYVHGHALNV